ncbi:MAG: alpha/beta hydrolase-fold protein, partial [Anaerolineaceae bacterium]|nr:alpha/beta hydrolase-fold protein [Anaerolineaceae bacterium]
PWVEATYPVCRQRACRVIGGISRGATWSMRLGMAHWDTFAAIGAHSLPGPPFSAARLRALLEGIPARSIPSLYLDTGTLDRYRRSAAEYHEMLERFSVPHQWHIFDGAHDEAYWQAHIPDYLRWYTRQWE